MVPKIENIFNISNSASKKLFYFENRFEFYSCLLVNVSRYFILSPWPPNHLKRISLTVDRLYLSWDRHLEIRSWTQTMIQALKILKKRTCVFFCGRLNYFFSKFFRGKIIFTFSHNYGRCQRLYVIYTPTKNSTRQ